MFIFSYIHVDWIEGFFIIYLIMDPG